jgi:DNA primase
MRPVLADLRARDTTLRARRLADGRSKVKSAKGMGESKRVIDDGRTLAGTASRRAVQLYRNYACMPEVATPEQLRGRARWLHRGALDNEERRQWLETVEAGNSTRARVDAACLAPF